MPLVYRLAADVVVVLHVAYVLFVVFGLLLTVVGALAGWNWIRNPWFRGIHLTMIGIVVFETWVGMTCPLSVWEWQLREWAGDVSYRGDFIANALDRLLFYDAPEWVFTLGYTLFGLAVGVTWLFVPPRWVCAALSDKNSNPGHESDRGLEDGSEMANSRRVDTEIKNCTP